MSIFSKTTEFIGLEVASGRMTVSVAKRMLATNQPIALNLEAVRRNKRRFIGHTKVDWERNEKLDSFALLGYFP